MIIHNGEVLRNLQEQVDKNKDDILYILEERGVLNQFGIRVMAVVKTVADIPTVDKYKEDNPEWSYGDCYMVGESEPYIMYILTRSNGTILNDYWLNIGQFPLAGPKGDKGDNGIGIDTMQAINFPSGTPSVTYDTTDGTMVHGTMDLTYMDGDSAVTENVGNVTVDIPITYGDGLKADATATNDKVEVKVDGEKVMKMPELDKGKYGLAVVVGKWYSGTSSTKVPDAIQWRDFQKNAKNNAMVQRTETGNVLLPEGFPADVGNGVDQYGNVIDNMAVPKGYVDSHSGGNLAWHTDPPTDTSKVIRTIATGTISLTAFEATKSFRITFNIDKYVNYYYDSDIQQWMLSSNAVYGQIYLSLANSTEEEIFGFGIPIYVVDNIQIPVMLYRSSGSTTTYLSHIDIESMKNLTWKYLY